MTLDELKNELGAIQGYSSPYGGVSEAASDVFAALDRATAVEVVLVVCRKQAETLEALQVAAEQSDASAWGKSLEKLYVYDGFFLSWLDISIEELGRMYL